MRGTYHNIRPLDPAVAAAMQARADDFFARARAAHDASADRRIAEIMAAERAALPLAA